MRKVRLGYQYVCGLLAALVLCSASFSQDLPVGSILWAAETPLEQISRDVSELYSRLSREKHAGKGGCVIVVTAEPEAINPIAWQIVANRVTEDIKSHDDQTTINALGLIRHLRQAYDADLLDRQMMQAVVVTASDRVYGAEYEVWHPICSMISGWHGPNHEFVSTVPIAQICIDEWTDPESEHWNRAAHHAWVMWANGIYIGQGQSEFIKLLEASARDSSESSRRRKVAMLSLAGLRSEDVLLLFRELSSPLHPTEVRTHALRLLGQSCLGDTRTAVPPIVFETMFEHAGDPDPKVVQSVAMAATPMLEAGLSIQQRTMIADRLLDALEAGLGDDGSIDHCIAAFGANIPELADRYANFIQTDSREYPEPEEQQEFLAILRGEQTP